MKQVNIIPFQSHLYLFACICIYNCILYSIFPVSSHSAIVIAGDNTIKEARCPHLRGKKLLVAESNENNEVKFDTSQVFINN